ncbi:MAG: hypothetical protein RIR65_2665 [Planctomycetota bacterium]
MRAGARRASREDQHLEGRLASIVRVRHAVEFDPAALRVGLWLPCRRPRRTARRQAQDREQAQGQCRIACRSSRVECKAHALERSRAAPSTPEAQGDAAGPRKAGGRAAGPEGTHAARGLLHARRGRRDARMARAGARARAPAWAETRLGTPQSKRNQRTTLSVASPSPLRSPPSMASSVTNMATEGPLGEPP